MQKAGKTLANATRPTRDFSAFFQLCLAFGVHCSAYGVTMIPETRFLIWSIAANTRLRFSSTCHSVYIEFGRIILLKRYSSHSRLLILYIAVSLIYGTSQYRTLADLPSYMGFSDGLE